MLEDTFMDEIIQLKEFSKLPKQKTGGNLFFVKKLLLNLYDVKNILKYALLLGSKFNRIDIANILNENIDKITSIFKQHNDFVVQIKEFDFKFTHDKIQEASSSNLSIKNKEIFHKAKFLVQEYKFREAGKFLEDY